jgi:hypothetical protein
VGFAPVTHSRAGRDWCLCGMCDRCVPPVSVLTWHLIGLPEILERSIALMFPIN